MIAFDRVSKRYPNGREALSNVSFNIHNGEMVFLTGRSGAGKSTVLKLIALLERPTRGTVVVNGKIRRGPLMYIKPGQTVWDVNLVMGARTVSIYSPNNLKLYENVHVFGGNDQFFSVAPIMVPNGQPPRADLKELPLPKPK